MILTADLCAHALIAASAEMPGNAITAQAIYETGRYPAAVALALEVKRPLGEVCAVLEVKAVAVAEARSSLPGCFKTAQEAARAAIRLQAIASAPKPAPEPEKPAQRPAPMVARIGPAKAPQRPVGIPGQTELAAKITDVLRDAPTTTSTLAILCDAKEMAVIEALHTMEHEGRVEAGPIPQQGKRHRNWRLVQERAA